MQTNYFTSGKKCGIHFTHLIFSVLLAGIATSCGNHHMLKEVKTLGNYPSASGIEVFNNQVYVIGDDANHLLVLDSNLAYKDSIRLYNFPGTRIPKELKADLESITLTADNKLFIPGSGSKEPYRNNAWLIDPSTHKADTFSLADFYSRLRSFGISELNIEGSCEIPGFQLLSNRGSKGFPKNHLIFTKPGFWKEQSHCPINTLLLGTQRDSSVFTGVSGLAYAKKSDRLLITVSTEDTRNNVDDGAIGKSYLWIVKNISAKKNWSAINPDEIIDLTELDARFKGQKIECVCITKETKDLLYLLLAADNDNGTSTLFKVILTKE